MNLSVEDIQWLAGYLEGEGCFSYTTNHKSVRVSVATTDLDIAVKVAQMLDSRNVIIAQYKNRARYKKTVYVTHITGMKALEIMTLVYSYMGERRKAKIGEIMSIWYTKKNKPPKQSNRKQAKNTAWINPSIVKEAQIV